MKELNVLIRLAFLYPVIVISLRYYLFKDAQSTYYQTAVTTENVPLAHLIQNSAAMDEMVTSADYVVCEAGGLPFDLFLIKSYKVSDGTHDIRVITTGTVPAVGQAIHLTATFQQQANGQLIKNWCILQETEPELREYYIPEPENVSSF